ncbi:hypothetical protein DM02DRAFT_654275 [Periconia macrospinosa]|uniref:F-box domain-containing protein n=1 Tax=Periconia macrospinosa TaxID=97972 RepID=A0A2V1DTN6_9PLEO|nr:hypothetical protein DM02DRAFT_654275 [Periconia macrospinosa]
MSSLDQFPEEILVMIANNIPERHLWRWTRTCRVFFRTGIHQLYKDPVVQGTDRWVNFLRTVLKEEEFASRVHSLRLRLAVRDDSAAWKNDPSLDLSNQNGIAALLRRRRQQVSRFLDRYPFDFCHNLTRVWMTIERATQAIWPILNIPNLKHLMLDCVEAPNWVDAEHWEFDGNLELETLVLTLHDNQNEAILLCLFAAIKRIQHLCVVGSSMSTIVNSIRRLCLLPRNLKSLSYFSGHDETAYLENMDDVEADDVFELVNVHTVSVSMDDVCAEYINWFAIPQSTKHLILHDALWEDFQIWIPLILRWCPELRLVTLEEEQSPPEDMREFLDELELPEGEHLEVEFTKVLVPRSIRKDFGLRKFELLPF